MRKLGTMLAIMTGLALSGCAALLREGPPECHPPNFEAFGKPYSDIEDQFGTPIKSETRTDGSRVLLFQCSETNVHNNGWASPWPWRHDAIWIDAEGIYRTGMNCVGDYADDNEHREANIATDAEACISDFRQALETYSPDASRTMMWMQHGD